MNIFTFFPKQTLTPTNIYMHINTFTDTTQPHNETYNAWISMQVNETNTHTHNNWHIHILLYTKRSSAPSTFPPHTGHENKAKLRAKTPFIDFSAAPNLWLKQFHTKSGWSNKAWSLNKPRHHRKHTLEAPGSPCKPPPPQPVSRTTYTGNRLMASFPGY